MSVSLFLNLKIILIGILNQIKIDVIFLFAFSSYLEKTKQTDFLEIIF